MLDRFSSTTLGRPFAIDDAVINVDVPNETSGCTFSHLARMSRISSDMHVQIYYPSNRSLDSLNDTNRVPTIDLAKSVDSRNILSNLRKFHAQLQSWKLQTPTFEQPTCIFDAPEFFDLNFHESRLWLFRAAINKLPVGVSDVRDKLLLLCLQAAQRIIKCFSILWQNDLATCSRSSTRLILISGLITVSVIKMQVSQPSRRREEQQTSDVDIDFWLEDLGLDSYSRSPTISSCRETLEIAAKLLSGLAGQMPDVLAYAQFFELLKRETEALDQSVGNSGPASRQITAGGNVTTGDVLLNPTTMPIGPEYHTQHQYANALAQHNVGLDTIQSSDLHRVGVGGTTLDGLLLDMFQGEHISNGNHGELLGNSYWSFPHAPWMEEIDGDISGFIWDTAMPWSTLR